MTDSEGVVLILGAGFSKWAANSPLADELFDFNVRPSTPKESEWLNTVRLLKKRWDETNDDADIEQFISYALTLRFRDQRRILWYIARRVMQPFGRRFIPGGRRNYWLSGVAASGYHARGVQQTIRFFNAIPLGRVCGIITTNYDLLVEYALGVKGFNYGSEDKKLLYSNAVDPRNDEFGT